MLGVGIRDVEQSGGGDGWWKTLGSILGGYGGDEFFSVLNFMMRIKLSTGHPILSKAFGLPFRVPLLKSLWYYCWCCYLFIFMLMFFYDCEMNICGCCCCM